jgi:hypothetical protein
LAGAAVGLIRSPLLQDPKEQSPPAERIDTRGAREIIRLKSSGSTQEIARRLGLARSTARETLKRAETTGLACSPGVREVVGDPACAAIIDRLVHNAHRVASS